MTQSAKGKPEVHVWWAVKCPRGSLCTGAHTTRHMTVSEFIDVSDCVADSGADSDWKYWYRKGYRCVKVKVEEL